MGNRIKGITIEIDGDTKGLDKSLSNITSESVKTSKELKDVNKLLKFDPSNIELVSQKQELLSKAVNTTSQKLTGLKNAQEQVDAQFKKGDIGEEQYRGFQREIQATEGQLKGYKTQLDDVNNSTDGLRASLSKAEQEFGSTSTEANQLRTKLEETERAMDGISDSAKNINADGLKELDNGIDTGNLLKASEAIGKIGDKAITAGGDGIEMANDINNASFKVSEGANQMGLSMDDAKKHIQAISEDGYGSFEEVGDAVSIVTNQLGDLNESDLDLVTKAGMNLEKVYGSDLDETMRGANALMTAYGMSGADAMDMITAGTKEGLDKTHELGDNLAEYAPLMEQNGISAKDYFQMLKNGLEDGAYNADKVNDVIKEMGIRINDGSARKGLETLGADWTSMYDKAKAGGKSNSEIMELIQKKIAGLPNDTKKAEAETAIWGTLAEDNGTKVMDSLFKTGKSFDDVGGKAKKLNDKADDNQKWQGSLQKLKDALLPIGTDLLNALTPIMEFIGNIAKGFGNLPGPIRIFIEVFGGITAVIAVLTPVIGALAVAFTMLNIPLLPLLGIIAGIAAVVTGIIVVIQHWGDIVKWLTSIWNGFSSWIGNLWNSIKEVATSLWNAMGTAIGNAVTSVKNVISNIWNSIKSITSNVFNGVKSSVSNIWNGIKSTITNVVNGIKSTISNVWNGIKSVTSSVFDGIKTAMTAPIKVAQGIISGIVNAIKSLFNFKLKFPKIDIPHIPLPHFSLKGSFNPLKGKIPSIGIDWYAKGGIFNKPTLFNTPQGMKGVGEAGAEAVIPLNKSTLAGIGSGIAEQMNTDTLVAPVYNFKINIQGNAEEKNIKQLTNEIMNEIQDKLRSQYSMTGGGIY